MELLDLLVTFDRPEFAVVGACAQTDLEAFFPEPGGNPEPARRVCAGCSVITECREYAVTNHELGVWGGTTERERQGIRRARRQIEVAAAEAAPGGRAA